MEIIRNVDVIDLIAESLIYVYILFPRLENIQRKFMSLNAAATGTTGGFKSFGKCLLYF